MIYFIQNISTKSVKIGYAKNKPENRRRLFQTGNEHRLRILGIIEGDKKDEGRLHRRFADRRINPTSVPGREWFWSDSGFLAEIDELIRGPITLFGRQINSVYLAGKITGEYWRESILGQREKSVCGVDELWFAPRSVPIPRDNRKLDYRGPFWLDLWSGNMGNSGFHRFGVPFNAVKESNTVYSTNGEKVRMNSLMSIANSDLVFAWINSKDCHGTIAEIAAAHMYMLTAKDPGPLIVIAYRPEPRLAEEMWFIFGMADHLLPARSPADAWDDLWQNTNRNVAALQPMESELLNLTAEPPCCSFGLLGSGEPKPVDGTPTSPEEARSQ